VAEIDGDREAAAEAVAAVVMEKIAATREVEVEAIAENATAVAVGEATVVATRAVVAPSATVTVNRYATRGTINPADLDN
jgi:hypothetical protein